MHKPWPTVSFGDVLTQFQEYIETPELRTYPKLSVKLCGIVGRAFKGES